MDEVDNCPVCNTTCKLEYGLEEAVGSEYDTEIAYATCKTCKTRWRRRDDPKDLGKLIYEKWACLIPAINLSFPFVGGGIKLPPRRCRWVKVTERRIPVGNLNGKEIEELSASKRRECDEIISLDVKKPAYYEFELLKNGKIEGEVSSDIPLNVYFMDEKNFDKYDRDKNYEVEDAVEGVFQAKIDFEATKRGLWFVVVENKSRPSVKVKVHLYSVQLL